MSGDTLGWGQLWTHAVEFGAAPSVSSPMPPEPAVPSPPRFLPPPPPAPESLASLLDALAAAMRARFPPDRSATSYFQYAVFDRPVRRDEPSPTIVFEGFARDPRGVMEVYHVTPPPLAGKTKSAWGVALRRWSRDADWTVTPQDGGAVRLTRRLTRKALADLVLGFLGEDQVAAVPSVLVEAVAPAAPLTAPALRLLQQKLVKRTKGAVPLDALRDVIRALPGWQWEESVPLARPYGPWGERGLDRRLAGLRPHVTYQARGTRPVDVHARVVNPWESGISPSAVPGPDDLALLAGVLTVVPAPLVDHAPVALPEGSWVAAGVRLDTDRYQSRVIRLDGLWQVLPAFRVTAPSGASWPLYADARDRRRPDLLDDPGFLTWAYARGLAADGEALVAATGERERAHALRAQREDASNVGECQLCGNMQKLRKAPKGAPSPVLVDHGYHYPDSEGWRGGYLGQRVDRCMGVGWRPYEKAHDCLDWMRPQVRDALAKAQAALAETERKIAARAPFRAPVSWLRELAKGEHETWTEVPADHPRWPHVSDRFRTYDRRAVAGLQEYLRWIEARVRTWVAQPLRDELRRA